MLATDTLLNLIYMSDNWVRERLAVLHNLGRGARHRVTTLTSVPLLHAESRASARRNFEAMVRKPKISSPQQQQADMPTSKPYCRGASRAARAGYMQRDESLDCPTRYPSHTLGGLRCQAYRSPMESLNTAHSSSNTSQMNIQVLAVLGERCSGTNMAESLIVSTRHDAWGLRSLDWCLDQVTSRSWVGHTQTPRSTGQDGVCWKHGHVDRFVRSDSCFPDRLFVVVFRNPLSWLQSLFHWQHQLTRRENMSEFISSPVTSPLPREASGNGVLTRIAFADTNPATMSPFSHPLEMRYVKARAWLALRLRVDNVYIVRMESIAIDPVHFLKELQYLFGLPPPARGASFSWAARMVAGTRFGPGVQPLEAESTDAGSRKHSRWRLETSKAYPSLTSAQMSMVRARLDCTLEHYLGYSCRE